MTQTKHQNFTVKVLWPNAWCQTILLLNFCMSSVLFEYYCCIDAIGWWRLDTKFLLYTISIITKSNKLYAHGDHRLLLHVHFWNGTQVALLLECVQILVSPVHKISKRDQASW
jgi:hypothetical protein